MKSDLRDSTPLFKSLAEVELSRVLSEQKQLFSRLVSGRVHVLLAGTPWPERLRLVRPNELPALAESAAEQPTYELIVKE